MLARRLSMAVVTPALSPNIEDPATKTFAPAAAAKGAVSESTPPSTSTSQRCLIRSTSSGTIPDDQKAERKVVYQSRRMSCDLLGFAIISDQVVGGTVVTELWFFLALKFRDDALRQDLPQFDAPLIERVDVPNRALSENGVLVQRHQFAQSFRCQPLCEDGIRRTIALEDAVGNEPLGRAFGFHLFGSFAECQRLGLRKDVRNEQIVVPPKPMQRLGKGDEVARDESGSLVNQLIERVLAVGSGFAPVDRASLVSHPLAGERNVLAIALHGQLLEVSRKPFQVLLVGQHSHRLRSKKIVVPDAEKTHQHWQVAFEGSGAEVFVHLVETTEHCIKIVRPDGNHGREANGRGHRVASTHPVPELEHVGSIDTELPYFRGIGRDRDKVLRDRLFVASESGERPGPGCLGVGHRLQRGDGFRRDDEECLRWIAVSNGLREVGAVDIRYKTKCHASICVVLQRLVGHYWAQVGAADADV